MTDFLKYSSIALICFAILAPIAYCEIQRNETAASLQIECTKAGGEWTTGVWRRPYCDLAGVPKSKADGG